MSIITPENQNPSSTEAFTIEDKYLDEAVVKLHTDEEIESTLDELETSLPSWQPGKEFEQICQTIFESYRHLDHTSVEGRQRAERLIKLYGKLGSETPASEELRDIKQAQVLRMAQQVVREKDADAQRVMGNFVDLLAASIGCEIVAEEPKRQAADKHDVVRPATPEKVQLNAVAIEGSASRSQKVSDPVTPGVMPSWLRGAVATTAATAALASPFAGLFTSSAAAAPFNLHSPETSISSKAISSTNTKTGKLKLSDNEVETILASTSIEPVEVTPTAISSQNGLSSSDLSSEAVQTLSTKSVTEVTISERTPTLEDEVAQTLSDSSVEPIGPVADPTPETIAPQDIDELAAAPSTYGELLEENLDSYVNEKLNLQPVPEGDDTVASAVAKSVASYDNEINYQSVDDSAAYNKATALATLVAKYPDLLTKGKNDPAVKELIGTTIVPAVSGDYSDERVQKLKSYLNSLSGTEGLYNQQQLEVIALSLVHAGAQLMTDEEKAAAEEESAESSSDQQPEFQPEEHSEPQNNRDKNNNDKGKDNRGESDRKDDKKGHEKNNDKRFGRLLNTIAKFESGGNYNAYYGNGGNHRIKFTSMSVGEVLTWQRNFVASGSPSSAVGKYQFIHGTLKSLVDHYDIPRDAKFDKDLQDELAVHLLEKRNLHGYLRGDIGPGQFAHELSKEWASLPRVFGSNPNASYYAGDGLNSAHIRVPEIMRAVKSVETNRERAQERHKERQERREDRREERRERNPDENTPVPQDHQERVTYFAKRLGIERNDINLTYNDGIAQFYINKDGQRKLGINMAYPYRYSYVDPWRMYGGQCVSWVAWRVAKDDEPGGMPSWGGGDNRPDLPGQQSGMADDWDENARGRGIPVNHNMAEGAVLVRNSGSFGHVMYFEEVYDAARAEFGVVSEYNFAGDEDPSVRIVSPQLLRYMVNHHNAKVVHLEQGKQGNGTASNLPTKNELKQERKEERLEDRDYKDNDDNNNDGYSNNGHGNNKPKPQLKPQTPKVLEELEDGFSEGVEVSESDIENVLDEDDDYSEKIEGNEETQDYEEEVEVSEPEPSTPDASVSETPSLSNQSHGNKHESQGSPTPPGQSDNFTPPGQSIVPDNDEELQSIVNSILDEDDD